MESTNLLSRARVLLASALELLDEANAPSDIGAHIDCAIERLSEALQEAEQNGRYETAPRNLSGGRDATN
jgi:hypothetical protein